MSLSSNREKRIDNRKVKGKREKEELFLCSSRLDAAAATQQSGATRHNYKEMNQFASLVLSPPHVLDVVACLLPSTVIYLGKFWDLLDR